MNNKSSWEETLLVPTLCYAGNILNIKEQPLPPSPFRAMSSIQVKDLKAHKVLTLSGQSTRLRKSKGKSLLCCSWWRQ